MIERLPGKGGTNRRKPKFPLIPSGISRYEIISIIHLITKTPKVGISMTQNKPYGKSIGKGRKGNK